MEIQGTFNAQRFFDTLALIISQRENVKVTVKVTQAPGKEKKEAASVTLGSQRRSKVNSGVAV